MIKEKFTDEVVEYYDSFFNNGEHVIGYTNPQSFVNHDKKYSIPRIVVDKSGNRITDFIRFIRYFTEYDYIAIHSIMAVQDCSSLLFLLPSMYMKKIVWIEWGADLYDDRKGIKAWIRNRFKSRVGNFVAIFPPDVDEYKQRFPKSRAALYYAHYAGRKTADKEYETNYPISKLKEHRKQRNTVVVQIGHNQNEMLNHHKALKILERFKHEDLRVFLPLSYGGSEEYAENVQREAERLFPGKTKVLRSFVPEDEYFDMLQDVDIAIFYTYRQAGLNNIYHLLWRKVKVYLPEKSTMYAYFISRGAPVCSIESILDDSFEDFISEPVVNNTIEYDKFWDERRNKMWSVEQWKRVFESLKERVN